MDTLNYKPVTHGLERKDVHPVHHGGRYSVTLNIGLGNNPYRDCPPDRRHQLYAYIIGVAFSRAGAPPVADTVALAQMAFGEPEDADVINFDIQAPHKLYHNPEPAIEKAVLELAGLTEQSAIAVTWADIGARDIATRTQGEELFGHDADAWRPFDPTLFHAFDDQLPYKAYRFEGA